MGEKEPNLIPVIITWILVLSIILLVFGMYLVLNLGLFYFVDTICNDCILIYENNSFYHFVLFYLLFLVVSLFLGLTIRVVMIYCLQEKYESYWMID